jgi:PAS domain S-box-containing protein
MAYPANPIHAHWRKYLIAYGFAAGIAALTLQAQFILSPWLGERPAYILFILPIIFGAYVGGLGPGLLATAVCAGGIYHFQLAKANNLLFFEGSIDLWNWVLLMACGILVSVLIELLHRLRKQTEAAHSLQAVTLTSIGDAVITTDGQGRITFLNAEAERLTEWSHAEARMRPLAEVFHIVNETTRQPVDDPATKVLRTGIVVGLANHTLLLGRQGRETIIANSGAPIQESGGGIVGVVLVFRDVTEHKHAEQAVQERERLLRQVMDLVPHFIFARDQQGRFLFANRACAQAAGLTVEAMAGRSLAETLADPQDVAAVLQDDREVIASGQARRAPEVSLTSCHGGKVILEVFKIPFTMPGHREPALLGVAVDITERKRLEEELRASGERMKFLMNRFKLIFETVPIGIAFQSIHPDGTILSDINAAHLRICGITRAQHDEPGIYDRATHPDDRNLRRPFDAEVAAGRRKQYSLEKRFVHPDGRVVWANFFYQREQYPDGTREELTTVTDITQRKTAEQQSRQLAVIVECSEEAIVASTLQGVITSWNRGAETIFGHAAAETVGQSIRLMYPPELAHEATEVLARIAAGESLEHSQTERIRKDGRRIRISATISPLRDAHGNILGAATIARDTTRQQMLEEQLRQSQKMEAIGQLAGGMAHDFNNILAVIQMQIELSREEGHFSPSLEVVQNAARRGANLTRQLLLFSRRQPLQPRDLDLCESIAGMAKMFQRILGEDIQIRLQYAPEPLLIHADASMVDQVLMNLTLNSRDAMPSGGELVIEAAAVEMDAADMPPSAQARPGGYVCLRVSDTGCGIHPEILPRIFEPFFTTKEVGKGTGLGLATVFSIVQQHQGWIQVNSQPGQGTTFQIFLPRLPRRSTPVPAPVPEPAAMVGGTETILLVEDDEDLRHSLHQCLSQLGYHLLEAATGPEALRLWQQHRHLIRLLITDLIMPGGLTGKELGEQLRQENPQLKVIHISGYSADSLHQNLPPGIAFLAKPFAAHALARAVRGCLDSGAGVPPASPKPALGNRQSAIPAAPATAGKKN